MFRRMPTDNNGFFIDVPSDVVIKILESLKPEDQVQVGQLNKFFKNISTSITLPKEQNLFILHSVMVKNYNHDAIDASIYINGDWGKGTIRDHLDKHLSISQESFLKEAQLMLSKHANDPEVAIYKKQFEHLILGEYSEKVLEENERFLDTFLSSLCYVRATIALNIFINKYPNAINSLSTEQFNLVCIAAAENHLYNFMHYLCRQNKSIDEYSLIPNSIGAAIITPFIAACLRVFQSSFIPSPIKIAKAKQTIELLIANNADPTKKYIYDDLTDEELHKELKNDKGYSITDGCEQDLEEYEKGIHTKLTASNIHTPALVDFAKFIVSLKVKIAEKHSLKPSK